MLPLLLVLTACAGGTEIGSSQAAITGGALETGYPAVFALAYDGQGGCTGTCVTPRVGLTAKHCVEGDPASSFTALFGDSEETPAQIIQVTALALAADADLAVLAFDEDCPATIPYNRAPLEDHLGEPVVMVGFGVTTEDAGDAGWKRSGTASLFSVDPAEVSGLEPGELATSNDPAGTCNGDSGGPTFMTIDGTEVMLGVTSRGSLDDTGAREWPCGMGRSIAVRADSHQTLIDDFIATHDPGREPPVEEVPPLPEGAVHDGYQAGGRTTGASWPFLALTLIGLIAFRRRRST